MKTKIRKNIWETNSSSTHSVIFSKEVKIDQTIVPKNGIVEIEVGEYGWEEESFYTPTEKASYVATAIMNFNEGEEKERKLTDFCDAISEITKAQKVIILPISGDKKYERMLKIGLKLSDQIPLKGSDILKIAEAQKRSEEIDWGYIDHQSFPTLDEEWFKDKESMKQFIFSSNNYFMTDNDNH